MTAVTFPAPIGTSYSDDATQAADMFTPGGYGYATHFLPLVRDTILVALMAVSAEASAAVAAASAVSAAAGWTGSSTTSLTVGAGTKSPTTSAGKQFVVGTPVMIFRTSAPGTYMMGAVTAYNSGTGAMTVDVGAFNGSGTFTDWTITLCGLQGPAGSPAANLTYLAKTSGYTVLATDKSSLIDCTSGSFTLAFQAVATLGAGWWAILRNSGTGEITLDPNSTEQIDALSTYKMYPGEARLVQCDGTKLTTVVLRPFARKWTASDTITIPPGYKRLRGLLWGAGGSGGKSGNTDSASGGGGGACVPLEIDVSTLGATEAYVQGAGGVAKSSAAAGDAGGNSTFCGFTAYGGGAGVTNSSNCPGGGGALSAGGTASGGQPRISGQGAPGLGGSDPTLPAAWGGSGSATPATAAGGSLYGGGGGGTVDGSGNVRAPGTSLKAGSGGAAGNAASGSDGAAPGGGGGGTRTGTNSGAGARGELQLWGEA